MMVNTNNMLNTIETIDLNELQSPLELYQFFDYLNDNEMI